MPDDFPSLAALSALMPYNPQEGAFQRGIRDTPWFQEFQQRYGEPNLNDPNYDYRAAWQAGARPTVRDAGDGMLHWPSQFKGPDHPNRYVGGVDTRTGAPVGSLAALEDRRDAPDMTPEWRNLPGALRAAGTSVGNYLWGTPQIPEATDTPLSDALGKRDIRLVSQVPSRSPLDQGIDGIADLLSMARKPGEKLGSGTPFTQRVFSKGR